MSGHSKWHSIKHKKGAADAKRGKIFTRHAKLIAICARDGGGDINTNPMLRTAIANAKADNVPNVNIEKAIKKGTGEDKDGSVFHEVMYEGFGPLGIVFYIQVITDNKNRSVGSVKTILSKNGGNMGEVGSVSWMFDKKGVILAELNGKDLETAELQAIDAGAQDLEIFNKEIEVITDPSELMKVKDNMQNLGFEVKKAEFDYLPKNTVLLDNTSDAKKALTLFDALDEDEDVSNVYYNFVIPDEIMEKI